MQRRLGRAEKGKEKRKEEWRLKRRGGRAGQGGAREARPGEEKM